MDDVGVAGLQPLEGVLGRPHLQALGFVLLSIGTALYAAVERRADSPPGLVAIDRPRSRARARTNSLEGTPSLEPIMGLGPGARRCGTFQACGPQRAALVEGAAALMD